jgi:hypothetical protein
MLSSGAFKLGCAIGLRSPRNCRSSIWLTSGLLPLILRMRVPACKATTLLRRPKSGKCFNYVCIWVSCLAFPGTQKWGVNGYPGRSLNNHSLPLSSSRSCVNAGFSVSNHMQACQDCISQESALHKSYLTILLDPRRRLMIKKFLAFQQWFKGEVP